MIRRPPRSTLFPYTTALPILRGRDPQHARGEPLEVHRRRAARTRAPAGQGRARRSHVAPGVLELDGLDRKSTRLNSSHANISYAVFCLKKKTTHCIASRVYFS